MVGNSELLMSVIRKDMKSIGASDYTLSDHTVNNESQIKVGANEIVYISFFATRQNLPFVFRLVSGLSCLKYTDQNTVAEWNGISNGTVIPAPAPAPALPEYTHHTSAVISKHRGDIDIRYQGSNPNYLIKYTKMRINSYEES